MPARCPAPLAWLLFGRGAVHGLDDGEHRARKELFLDLLGPEQVAVVAEDARARLLGALDAHGGQVVDVHRTLVETYGAAVLRWVGIDLPERGARRLSREYARIVDGFGFAGPAYLRAWVARRTTDAWARALVTAVRGGRLGAGAGSAVAALAGSGLDDHTAAVELGNIVRPTIAVSWLGTFAALALDGTPSWRPRLADPGGQRERWAFSQEVRRLVPFVPALAGRVRATTSHAGVDLRAGNHVVLDVRGINLDPVHYPEPWTFDPARFLSHEPSPFDLVPQGGGPADGHRCPGESMALQLLSHTVRTLAETNYVVESPTPVDLTRMPTLPAHGLRIRIQT